MSKSSKGSCFERSLCSKLSMWWSDGLRDDLFWRTSGSGARATVRGRKGKSTRNHCGDITNTDSVGQSLINVMCFEFKRGYSRHTITDLLDCPINSKQQVYEEWFEKAERSRSNAGSFSWVLIHKRDYRETLIFMPMKLWVELKNVGVFSPLIPNPFLSFTASLRRENGDVVPESIVGFHLADFFIGVKPEHILEVNKRRLNNVEKVPQLLSEDSTIR